MALEGALQCSVWLIERVESGEKSLKIRRLQGD